MGKELKDIPRAEQHANCVAAFRATAPLCEDAGLTLSIETLNVLVNHKGYYLNVFRAIAAKGYTGFLGLEMWPTVAPAQAIRESITLLAEATGRPR